MRPAFKTPEHMVESGLEHRYAVAAMRPAFKTPEHSLTWTTTRRLSSGRNEAGVQDAGARGGIV